MIKTNQIREVTSQVTDGVFIIDIHGCITFINVQGEKLLGWHEKELSGLNSHDVFHHSRPDGSRNPGEDCPIHRTVITGIPHRIEEDYFVRRDGSFLPVSLSSTPIFKDGEVTGAVITFHDNSARLSAQQTIREREQYFQLLFNSTRDATFVVAINPEGSFGQFLEVNEATCLRYGYSREELLEMTPAAFNTPEGVADLDVLAKKIITERLVSFERMHVTRDGRQMPVEVHTRLFEFNGQLAALSSARDISKRKMLEKRDLRAYINRIALNALLEVALEPISLKQKLGVSLDIIHTVPRMAIQAKGSIMLVTEKGDLELAVERDLGPELVKKCQRVALGYCLCGRAAQTREMVFSGDIDARHDITFPGMKPHGHYCVPIISRGELLGVLNLYVDTGHVRDTEEEAFLTTVANTLAVVIERGKLDEKVQYMASHDPLTALPNRVLFKEHLDRELRHAIRDHSMVMVAFLDLDRFKAVNDTLGHEAGDLLLKAVVQRLRRCLRDSDTLARLGGDEFTLILPAIDGKPGAAHVANKIIRAIQEPFAVFGQSCQIGVSIGMSCYPDDGAMADELIQKADQAMYVVKNRGRNNYAFYEG